MVASKTESYLQGKTRHAIDNKRVTCQGKRLFHLKVLYLIH